MHARCCMRPPKPYLCNVKRALDESCTELHKILLITQSATIVCKLHAVHRPRDVQLEAKRLFKLIDLDGNGRIALEELAGVLGFQPPPVPAIGTKHGASSLPPGGAGHSACHPNSRQVSPEAHANAIDQAHGMLRQNPMLMVRVGRGGGNCPSSLLATVLTELSVPQPYFDSIPTHSGRYVPYDESPSAQMPKVQRTRGISSCTWPESSARYREPDREGTRFHQAIERITN